MNLVRLRNRLVRTEGYKTQPYFDHLGNVTFGIGRNLITNPLTTSEKEFGIANGFDSPAFVDELYDNDVGKILQQMEAHLPWWRTLTDVRQEALFEMVFQLGIMNVLEFNESLPLLRAGRYREAATKMRKSKWRRKDTPKRAEEVISMFETGVHVP